MNVTVDRLRELFSYDPVTGLLTRKVWTGGRGGVNEKVGKIRDGYIVVGVDYEQIPAHHIAWALHHGGWPDRDLDHKDRDRSNNRIENLRLATPFQNRGNVAKYRNNRSGFKGVFWHAQSRKWQAMIRKDGRGRHLGLFISKEQAAAAYDEAARVVFGEFARLNLAA